MKPARKEKENNMSNTNETETKKAPVAKIRVGLITASIWENTTAKGTFANVTFERRYKDGQDNWQSSHSYNADDLLALAKAADLAHTRILEARNGSGE
jgi:hypothetical protein